MKFQKVLKENRILNEMTISAIKNKLEKKPDRFANLVRNAELGTNVTHGIKDEDENLMSPTQAFDELANFIKDKNINVHLGLVQQLINALVQHEAVSNDMVAKYNAVLKT